MKKEGYFSSYTGWIILVNVIVFILGLILLNQNSDFVKYLAIQPAAIISGKYIWTFITSMFMHAGFNHLIFNMISLMFIGGFVEKLIGKKRFLAFYFASGLLAGFLFVLVAFLTGTDLNVYAVGASGAIFGLGGLLAVLTPRLPVLVFFVIPLPMWAAMIGMLGILWILSATAGLPIGNIAHLGGLLTGLAYGFYLKIKYPKKTQMIARYFAR
jgi:membrane associated rhomboid family serine protease